MLDLDPHGSMSSYFKFDPDNTDTSTHNLFHIKGMPQKHEVVSLIGNTPHENLKIIPSSTLLATLERQLQAQEGLGLKISRALDQVADLYDYAVIDSPPVLGVLMINALAACERLVIPVQTEHLAIKGLERMEHTLKMINRSRKQPLKYTIVPTMYDRRTHASVGSLRYLRNNYVENCWPSMIPVDTRFRDASKEGLPISMYDASARGCLAYAALTKFLLDQHDKLPG
jgi:chromosome partitioning protein